MAKAKTITLIALGLLFCLGALVFGHLTSLENPTPMLSQPALLSDPFLQSPTESSVKVVWFTEFEGSYHQLIYGDDRRQAAAKNSVLSRSREDEKSKTPLTYSTVTPRPIWRHEAEAIDLLPGQRYRYQVVSQMQDGTQVSSDWFSLGAKPAAGESLNILLTSDHQLMPMTAANLQKVEETIGQVDGVFLAGDLVNVPDRASEWFDDARGGAFFPCLQGKASYSLTKNGRTTVYQGGQLIQHAPLFTAVGNHEVMGRYSTMTGLDSQFNDPVPWDAAKQLYDWQADLFNPSSDAAIRQQWLADRSFNIDTYTEIFSLPSSPRGSESTQRYYATTFGDIRLISLYVTQIWRSPSLKADVRGRYRERTADLANPVAWGHGQFIFESIEPGSPQYEWLKSELASDKFQQAKYKIVMLHHPPHTLGGNIVPAFTTPVPNYERDEAGRLTAVRYEYPRTQDHLMQHLVPLLDEAGVQLVFYGHSHLWNRFVGASGMHFLESSNVGNSYGAHTAGNPRPVPDSHYQETYAATGDPNGLEPVMPTLAPLTDDGRLVPYIASNDVTAFSIFNTGSGKVSSYYFDSRQPDSAVVRFDEFTLDAPS